MPKPPSALLASSGGLHHLLSSSTVSIQSPQSVRHNRTRTKSICSLDYCPSKQSRRAHTTSNPPSPEDLSWPRSRSATSIPTPYEIFKLHPSAPYSKRRFYELVKVYHPDSTSHSSVSTPAPPGDSAAASTRNNPSSISHTVRLHRYRLIIQAHSILSDPAKRAAYDRYGAGWGGQPDIVGLGQEQAERNWQRHKDQKHSPHNCATWEDWEGWHRWRYEHERASTSGYGTYRQRPVYISNGGFVVLIVLFTITGTVHEISRAGKWNRSYLEQLDQVHDETSKQLNKTKAESRGFEDNDQRVQKFLKERKTEPTLAGAIAEKEGGENEHGRLSAVLPPSEVCRNSQMRERRLSTP